MTDHLADFLEHEFVAQISRDYMTRRSKANPPEEAVEQVMYEQRFGSLILPQERALMWLALAATQARHDTLLPLVRAKAELALSDESWLPLWIESLDHIALRKRQLDAVREIMDRPPPHDEIEETPPYTHEPPLEEKLATFWKEIGEFAPHYASKGIDIEKDDPSVVVAELSRELDEILPRYQNTPEAERNLVVGRLGMVWTRQVLRLGGWRLGKITDDEGREMGSMMTADATAFLPIFMATGGATQNPQAANVIVPLFERLRSNDFPRSRKPGGLVQLLLLTWRLEDRDWPAQREQLMADQPSVDAATAAVQNVFSTLKDAGEETECEPQMAEEVAEEQRQPPDAATVAGRALALKALLNYTITEVPREILASLPGGWSLDQRRIHAASMKARRDTFVAGLQVDGVWEFMDATERAIAETPLTELDPVQLMSLSWRVEALACLMWALRRFDAIPPYDTKVDGMALLQRERFGDGPRDFVAAAKLRSDEDVEAARSIAEMWHWRSRTRFLKERGDEFPEAPEIGAFSWDDIARISAESAVKQGLLKRAIDGDFPALGRAYRDVTGEEWSELTSIVMERHFALNWMRGYAPDNEWLRTPTGT